MTGSFGLVSTLVLFPDYCLVYVVGISADCSIHPGAGTELVDHGPPELEGAREWTPYGQEPGRRHKPAYGATIHVVNAHKQNVLVMS